MPTIKAILDSPELQLDGFLGPGHVSMVIGTRPYDFIAEHYRRAAGGRRLRAARRAAVDLDGAEADRRGPRARSRTNITRVVPETGNATALRAVGSVFELREFFEWRGLGSIDHSGVRLREAYARFDAERKFAVPQSADRRPEVLPVRRGAEGRDQAAGMQGVRHGLHAGDAARRADGVVRRRLRRLLPIWRRHPPGVTRNRRMSVLSDDMRTALQRGPAPRHHQCHAR